MIEQGPTDPRDALARAGAGSAAYLNAEGTNFEEWDAMANDSDTWETPARPYTDEHYELARRDAGLGVGHIWWRVACPAYVTYDPSECTCKGVTR